MQWIWVDKILSCDPGKEIRAVKYCSKQETYFKEQFLTGQRLVPEVMQIEMIVGGASICGTLKQRAAYVLYGVEKAIFHSEIALGQECAIHVLIESWKPEYFIARGTISIGDQVAAECQVRLGRAPLEMDLNYFELIRAWPGFKDENNEK